MNNTYAFADAAQTRREIRKNITTISQMVANRTGPAERSDRNWMLGTRSPICRAQRRNVKPLQQAYQMQRSPANTTDGPGLVYNAVRDGLVDAGLVYTDGRVKRV